jgi:O-antigen/teichoic acid export membrane protein
MNREFLVNIIFLITVNLLIKPFYIFGIDRTVQNTVETGEYGMYYAFFNFAFLLQIINDFGIQNYNNRNIAQHNQLLDKYFSNILVLKGILGLTYLVLIYVAAWALGYLEDYADYSHLIFLMAFNWILISLILFFRSNISGLAMYRTDSMLSVLDKLLLIIVCSILLWANPFNRPFQISWFVYAQTATLFLTALIAFLIVYKQLTSLRFRFQKAFLLLILKKSYPYALVVFLMLLYTRMDAVMIERMLPDGQLEVDYYASAYRLLEASNMIGFLFAGLLLPMFAKMIKKGEAVNDLVRFSFQMIWAGAISLTVAIFFFQEDIMILLYKNGSAYSGQILAYLMFSFVALAGSYIYGTLLTANDSLMKMNFIFIISVFIN